MCKVVSEKHRKKNRKFVKGNIMDKENHVMIVREVVEEDEFVRSGLIGSPCGYMIPIYIVNYPQKLIELKFWMYCAVALVKKVLSKMKPWETIREILVYPFQ